MNTEEKAMLESTTALVWEHQRDIQELTWKIDEIVADVPPKDLNPDLYRSLCEQLASVWVRIDALGLSVQRLSCQVDSLAAKELL